MRCWLLKVSPALLFLQNSHKPERLEQPINKHMYLRKLKILKKRIFEVID